MTTTALAPATRPAVSPWHEHPDLRLFDLLQESLSEARALMLAGDGAGALACLDRQVRDHLRQSVAGKACNLEEQRQLADLMLERKFVLGFGGAPVDLGTPVDWRARYEEEPCWNGHMGGFYGFTPLARVYAVTSDQRYAGAWCAYVSEFLDADWYGNPGLTYFPSRPMYLNDRKSCDNGEGDWDSPWHWNSLCAGERALTWLECCGLMADSPHLTPALLLRILRSIYEDTYLILINNPRSNTPNQFLSTSTSLLRLGMILPEMRNASACFLVGYQRLQEAIETQMYPDGTDLEQSPNYNWGLPPKIGEVLELLHEAPESRKTFFREAARKRIRYLCHACTPDLGMIDLSKAHHADNLGPWLLEHGRHFAVPEALWIATRGAEGTAPPFRSVAMPYAGYYVLRSGYDSAADYLFFKASARGAGHMSEDSLGLMLAAGGRRLLIDSGNYSYTNTTPIDNGMNEYSFKSISHSVALVDGLGQARGVAMRRVNPNPHDTPLVTTRDARKLANRALAGDRFEYVEGSYADGFGATPWPNPPGVAAAGPTLSLRHARRILWVKGRGWLVIDLLDPADADTHDFSQLWMLAPDFAGACEILAAGKAIRTTAEGTNLHLRFLNPGHVETAIFCGQDDPMRGWYSVNYGRRVPKPDVEVRWRGASLQIVATWIQTDATPALLEAEAQRHGERLHALLRFADGAHLEVDTGLAAGPLRLSGVEAEAETGALWVDAAGRVGALVDASRQALLPDRANIEFFQERGTASAREWPALAELA